MEQTELGRTKIVLSAIGFGGMPLSITGRPDEAAAKKVLHASLDAGVTLVDTADVYCLDDNDIGHNERLIAAVLRERRDRDQIRVATKGGLRRPRGEWTRDGSPKHLREACEASLRALGVNRIFLYQLHAPDPNVPLEKSVGALAALHEQGKIEHVGLSNVSVEQIDRAIEIVGIQSVQNRFNPFFREALDEGVVQACDGRGITFFAYSPLGGGRLSRKIPNHPILQQIAKSRGCSPAAVTLGWLRAKGKRVVPIPGASKVENARDSAAAASVHLSAKEVAAIDGAEFSRA